MVYKRSLCRMSCSHWHSVPSGVLFVFFASPPPSLRDPNGNKLFYKAFWAILGTLQLFINCVLDISALLL